VSNSRDTPTVKKVNSMCSWVNVTWWRTDTPMRHRSHASALARAKNSAPISNSFLTPSFVSPSKVHRVAPSAAPALTRSHPLGFAPALRPA
jgi:hypothetical protein